MEKVHGTRVPAPRSGQLAIALAGDPAQPAPPGVQEAAPGGYSAWSTEEIVRLHFILLDDLRRLADADTPLEERFELVEWVFTERALEARPFSFRSCVRLYMRTCDVDGVRDELRPLLRVWLDEAVATLPAWLGERILREPQWAASELHRNPQWINEALARHARDPDLFGALPIEPVTR